jgi:2-polyprenyl-6-hydroxyphenyl methylase/3-demethylubiquinone-9 3-methyltransferase
VIKGLIKKLLLYRPIRITQTTWDKRYREGAWERIRSIEELARYSIIVGYAHFVKKEGSILDVGCGEGILCKRLCKSRYSRYLGIDVSAVALDKASVNSNEKNKFHAAKIMEFRTDQKFDVIVFNECLYYMEEPLKTLQHYGGFLARNGLLIVSMHKTNESTKIWKQVDKHYSIMDAVSVINAKGGCWIVKMLGVR